MLFCKKTTGQRDFVMKHTFLINLGKDIDPKYVTWTKETITEFLKLFPEYEDKFEILVYDGSVPRDDYIDLGNKKVKFNSSMCHLEDYLNEKLPEGTNAFEYTNNILSINGEENNYLMWLFSEAAKGNYYHSIALTNLTSNDNTLGRSYSIDHMIKEIDPENLDNTLKTSHTIMRTHNVDSLPLTEEFFKVVLMHEIGHAFRAGHNNSTSAHCDTPNCLMEQGEDNVANKGKKPSFCSTCIKNMRKHMSFMFTNNTRANGSKLKLNVFDAPQELPPNTEVNDEFKLTWREFAQKLAQKMSWQYEEDERETNFKAKLKAGDGSYTYVNASSKNDVSLSAKDKDGNPKIPDMQVFNELVAKTQKDNGVISFGDIKTPEFKARLLIACMSANPPVKTENAPEINDAFLSSIDKASAQKLKILKNKLEAQKQPEEKNKTQTPKPEKENQTSEPKKETVYTQTKALQKRCLIAKEKKGTISPAEKEELQYIEQTELREQALKDAIARTGNAVAPRTAEHISNSGLKPKNSAYSSSSNRAWKGWKLHLDVVPNNEDKTTSSISSFLRKLDVDHKIAKGGENGKGMTVYVGSYDDAIKLAKEIESRYGKFVSEPPIYTDQKKEEIDLNNIVTGRFYLQDIFQTQYPRSSVQGLCPADYGSLCDHNMESVVVALAKNNGLISDNYAVQSVDNSNFHDRYIACNIESYCAHRFYQKHLSEFYCGKNPDKFEEKVFGAKLPEKGSEERKKWDDIADKYAAVLEKENPRCIESIKELKESYTPIDFSKAPPRNNFNNRISGGRN